MQLTKESIKKLSYTDSAVNMHLRHFELGHCTYEEMLINLVHSLVEQKDYNAKQYMEHLQMCTHPRFIIK